MFIIIGIIIAYLVLLRTMARMIMKRSLPYFLFDSEAEEYTLPEKRNISH